MVKQLIRVDFKNALAKHIPKGHVLNKVINCHVTKLAYCTMPNMEARVNTHNSRIQASNEPENEDLKCDCSKTKKGLPNECKWGESVKKGTMFINVLD